MSTFFEKLTGAKTIPTPGSISTSGAVLDTATPRPIRRPSVPLDEMNARPPRVKPEAVVPEYQREEIPEEEGELTVDIYDAGDNIVIQSTVAGVKPEDLDVSISEDTITIRGKRTRPSEVTEEHYYYKELFWGSFLRTIILPEEIEKDAAEASLKHGLLTISLPKKRRGAIQKLKVKTT